MQAASTATEAPALTPALVRAKVAQLLQQREGALKQQLAQRSTEYEVRSGSRRSRGSRGSYQGKPMAAATTLVQESCVLYLHATSSYSHCHRAPANTRYSSDLAPACKHMSP
jgi:hypothetical protein